MISGIYIYIYIYIYEPTLLVKKSVSAGRRCVEGLFKVRFHFVLVSTKSNRTLNSPVTIYIAAQRPRACSTAPAGVGNVVIKSDQNRLCRER